ncbi:MAG: DUF2341 domain-containing protein [Bacteroidetes bacterium]|nr:DUF2341 domain-containing protein [Bacteroidota bacterium]
MKANKAITIIAYTLICLNFFSAYNSFSQGIAVNTNGAEADNSSILDVSSTNQGVLISRMSNNQRIAISSPATGLMVYNTDCNNFNYYNGSEWVDMVGNPVTLPPSAPTATAGSGAAQTQITANWSASSSATGYYIDVATDNGFTAILTNYNNVNVSNVLSYNITGLSCGNAYYYRVRAYNQCGKSGNSGTITYSTTACCSGPPAQPGSISGNSFSCTASPTLTYNISAVSEATSYTWSVPSGATINSGQGSTSINVTFGSNSGDVSVTASNACGTSAASNLAVTVCNLSSWQYSKPVPVSNTSGGALTNYQISLTVTYVAGKMKSDFSDLRFTDGSCTLLNYWIDTYTASTTASVWVKVPSIPTAGTNIFMYYGNSLASSLSSATNTFDLYDDFNAGSFNSSMWTTTSTGYGCAYVTQTGGYLEIGRTSSCVNWTSSDVFSNATFNTANGYIFEAKVIGVGGDNWKSAIGWGGTQSGELGGDDYFCTFQNCGSDNVVSIMKGSCGVNTYSTGSTNTVYTWGMGIAAGGTVFKAYRDGVLLSNWNINCPATYYAHLRGGGCSGTHYQRYDWARVRKYASPEPSATFGSEVACP